MTDDSECSFSPAALNKMNKNATKTARDKLRRSKRREIKEDSVDVRRL